jgi:putative endonuclease
MQSPTQQQGSRAEARAKAHLESHGLRCIAMNWRCKLGEIDLICWDNHTLVLVEVRERNHGGYGTALDSITLAKRRKILRAAQVYLQRHPTEAEVRFDAVGIDPSGLTWVKAAFSADS